MSHQIFGSEQLCKCFVFLCISPHSYFFSASLWRFHTCSAQHIFTEYTYTIFIYTHTPFTCIRRYGGGEIDRAWERRSSRRRSVLWQRRSVYTHNTHMYVSFPTQIHSHALAACVFCWLSYSLWLTSQDAQSCQPWLTSCVRTSWFGKGICSCLFI